MLSRYKNANKDLKEYRVSKVKAGTTRKGGEYTVFTIADSRLGDDGNRVYDNYTVFSWQKGLNLQEEDRVVLEDVSAIDVREEEYAGKKYIKKVLHADVRITQSANPNKVEVVGDLPDFDNIDPDSLPF